MAMPQPPLVNGTIHQWKKLRLQDLLKAWPTGMWGFEYFWGFHGW